MQKLNNITLNDWYKAINKIGNDSESGGRLANYRLVKGCPSVEEYVLKGGQDRRRVLTVLRCGRLPLQIEKSRTIHPKVALENRFCRLCFW